MSGSWVLLFFLCLSNFIAISYYLGILMRELLYSLPLIVGFCPGLFGHCLRIMPQMSLFRGNVEGCPWPGPGPQPSPTNLFAIFQGLFFEREDVGFKPYSLHSTFYFYRLIRLVLASSSEYQQHSQFLFNHLNSLGFWFIDLMTSSLHSIIIVNVLMVWLLYSRPTTFGSKLRLDVF